MDSPLDTIAAIATPLGEGGIGVIRISGERAMEIAGSIFRKITPSSPAATGRGSIDSPPATAGNDLCAVQSHTCHVGFIVDKEPIDQVVLTLFRSPHSYTGEDVVEISAHGSPFVLGQILKLCVRHGARLAGPGEFTQRAFLSGKLDLTQAEAVADLIRARTDKTQAAALAQLEGRLAARVRDLREAILPLLAHVEVGLDHSDEDHDFLQRDNLVTRCQAVQEKINELLDSARVGKILREGLRVALVGRPNVGKSSLLNALLKEERAIVTPIPGTTRDTLEEAVNWEGLPVVLTDTAGMREKAGDPVERLGMERSRQAIEGSDLVLALFDGSEELAEADRRVMALVQDKPHFWVINKIDLKPSPRPRMKVASPSWGEADPQGRVRVLDPVILKEPLLLEAPPHPYPLPRGGEGELYVSAKTGAGLEELVAAVKQFALQEKASAGEAQWLLNARHLEALTRAHEALAEATRAAQQDAYEECVALELKTALQALGEIIGETATEDLLDQIFSKFCIGK